MDPLTRYKLRFGKTNRYTTVLFMIIAICVIVSFFVLSSGSYLPGWATILGVAVVLLVFLSMPRSVVVSRNYLELHCLLDVIRIDLMQIQSIEIVTRAQLKYTYPFLAVWGLFGYFGLYMDYRRGKLVRMHSQELRNLIRVEYDGGRVIYFSVGDYEALVADIRSRIGL